MEKISKLIVALFERTSKDIIAWQETADDDTFQYSLPNGTVRIADGGRFYYFSILNDVGRVVDGVSSYELDMTASADPVEGISSYKELMELLYLSARRKALKSDATLDGILSQLGVEA